MTSLRVSDTHDIVAESYGVQTRGAVNGLGEQLETLLCTNTLRNHDHHWRRLLWNPPVRDFFSVEGHVLDNTIILAGLPGSLPRGKNGQIRSRTTHENTKTVHEVRQPSVVAFGSSTVFFFFLSLANSI